jgi:hypothetical protein
MTNLAYTNLVRGNYEQALRYSGQLLSFGIKERDSLQISRGLAIKASVLRRTGFINSAMQLYNTVYPIGAGNCYEEEFKNVTNSLGLLHVSRQFMIKR